MILFPQGPSVNHSALIELPPGEKSTIKEMENTALTFQESSMWKENKKRYSRQIIEITIY